MSVNPIQKTPIILNNNKLWLNADYPIGVISAQPADATAVSAWTNLGGEFFTCTQGSGTSQPVFKRNVNAGKSGILFDGSNDGMTLTGGGGPLTAANRFASTTAFTQVVTFKMNATGVAQVLESMRGTVSTDKTTLGIDVNNFLYFEVNTGVTTTTAISFTDTTKPHIAVATNDGANTIALYLDGVLVVGGTATSTTTASNSVVIGNIGALTHCFSGYIFDFIYFTGVIPTAQRTSITQYLANLRGVAI